MSGLKRRVCLFFEKIISLGFLILLFFISKKDKESFIIPARWNGYILVLALLRAYFGGGSLCASLSGFLLGGGIFLLAYLASGGKGVGGGDVKLAAAGGAMLGTDILYALFLGCGYACLAYLWGLLRNRGGRQRYFALGPFLCAGMASVLLLLAEDFWR